MRTLRHSPVSAASFAACAVCFSLRAMFRVCHDLFSVFGFGFSFLCDSRLCGVVVAISSFQFVPAWADAPTFSVEHAVFAEPHRGYATGCCVRRTGRDRPLLPQCYPMVKDLVDQTGIEPVTS